MNFKSKIIFPIGWIVDYLFIPLFIFWCAFEPNFMHGLVDYLDEGQHLSVINEVFHGKIPLKDAVTIYGPLHIYLPALAMQLFGKSLGTLRAYFHFGSILSLIIAYLLGRAICKSRFFSYLIAFLLLSEVHHPFWSCRWGGIRMGLGLSVLLFMITFIKKRKNIWLLWAGIFSAFSLLYSIEIGIFSFVSAISAIIFVSFTQKNHHIFRAVKIFLIYLAGSLLIVLPFLLYLFIRHALWPFLTTSFAIIYRYHIYHIEVWGQSIPNFLFSNLNPSNFIYWLFSIHFKFFLPIFIYSIVVLYIFLKLIKKAEMDTLIIISILTIYGLLLYITSFRTIVGSQFQTALPLIIILECFLLENFSLYCKNYLHTGITSIRKKITVISFLCILFLSFVYLLGSEKKYYSSLKGWFLYQMDKKKLISTYTMSIPIYEVHLFALEIERARGILVPRYQKEDIDGVTQYIIKNTKTNESVFTFPEHGIFNFFTDRPVVGRFPIASLAWVNKEYRIEILKGLYETKPRYVILGKVLSNTAKAIGSKEELLPEISGFIKRNYILVRSFNTIDIYHLK